MKSGDAPATVLESAYILAEKVERPIANFFEFAGRSAILFFEALIYIVTGACSPLETVRQMSFVGVKSIPIVVLTVSFSGAVMSLFTAELFVRFGATDFVGGMIGRSMVVEIAPVLTGIVVAARSGSAMAAQIGSMKVTEQIDALRSMAVSPVRYLVAPRLVASAVMLPVLTVYADIVGWLGGMLVAHVYKVPVASFVNSTKTWVGPEHVLKGLLKTVVFGIIIATVSSQQGLSTTKGAEGVGRATTGAVVLSIVLIYVADYLLSTLLFV